MEPIPDQGGAAVNHGAVDLDALVIVADGSDAVVALACAATGQRAVLGQFYQFEPRRCCRCGRARVTCGTGFIDLARGDRM